MKKTHGVNVLLLLVVLISCQKQPGLETGSPGKAAVTLRFDAVVDEVPLAFNTEYRNHLGEPYSVSAFKFYICKIVFINTASGTTYEADKDGHYLIDAGDQATSSVSLQVDPAKYDKLAFVIGVDSSRNFSGAQTGALDPAKGMFWTWNSGYIMAKLEGSSPLSSEPNNKIEYHIGGFKGPDNVSQQVQLSLPVSEADHFAAGSSATIRLSANVNKWFHNSTDLSIAANPVCMTPGDLSKTIAANYASMFTLVDISH